MDEIELIRTGKTDEMLAPWMADHYSNPGGFVGRHLIYLIRCGVLFYGAIVAGSATKHLPGRTEFFTVTEIPLNRMVNNTFFHLVKPPEGYPIRNFAQRIVAKWRQTVELDWFIHYGDKVFGWETLVELPRTGELYLRDGWTEVGLTKGYTCKRTKGIRIAGSSVGSDQWGGRRVWDKENLRPKRVFVRRVAS